MKKIISIVIVILISLTFSSCTKQTSPQPKIDELQQPTQTIEDFEVELINVMSQVDLVPYYEKQIAEKKKKEKEQKQGKSQGQKEEFKPTPATLNDVLLMEILKQEKPEDGQQENQKKIPDDIVFIWHEINGGISKLHEKWNELKPKLERSKISANILDKFGDTLNSLTAASTEKKHLETLNYANQLTSYFPEFVKGDDVLASIYTIKYHTRQVVLNAANNNFQNAEKDVKAIKSKEKKVTSELEKKKVKDLGEKFTISVSDLEKAVTQKDINVMKVKASIVMKNIFAIQEKLATM